MTRLNAFLLLSTAALGFGCTSTGGTQDGDEDVVATRQALEAVNGYEMNGTAVNGNFLNGVRHNGVRHNGVRHNGTGLEGTDSDTGLTVSGTGYTGVDIDGELGDATPVTVRIESVSSSDVPGIYTYEITAGGNNVCGTVGARALLLPGLWNYLTGAYVSGSDFTVACRDAAIAKCVEWGYPDAGVWTESNGGDSHDISLNYFHQACVRMVRADYCGDGHSHTANGTVIDLFDAKGIQTPAAGGTMPFEAEWSANGATCVKHPRWTTAAHGNAETYIKDECDDVWAGTDRPAANAACGSSSWAAFTSSGYASDPATRGFLRNKSDQH